MKSFKLSLLLLLLCTAIAQPMDIQKNNQQIVQQDQGQIPQFPLEIILHILTQKQCKYPWQEIARLYKLKTVCKAFNKAISDDKTIATWLGIPPLHFAAATGNVEEIIKLKLAGHSLHEPDASEFRPAHYAVGNKQIEAMKIMKIGNGLKGLKDNLQLIQLALKDKDLQTIKYLRKLNLNFNYSEKELMNAIENNQTDKVSTILEYATGAIITKKHIEKAQEHNYKKIETLLLYSKKGYLEIKLIVDIIKMNNPPSTYFDQFNYFKANLQVSNQFGSPLHLAVINKNVEFIKLLIKNGANITIKNKIDGYTPVHVAVHFGKINSLKLLLKQSECNVNAQCLKNYTPLHLATLDGQVECIKLLIQHGADINAQNYIGATPLQIAVQSNQQSCFLELLYTPGINVNVTTTNNGLTPLHYAASFGRNNFLQKLLDHPQCNVNVQDPENYTPLHYAALYGHIQCIKHLIKKGANTHAKSKVGLTPLDIAETERNAEAVKTLLEYDANKTLKTKSSQTALELAQENGQNKIDELLK